MRSDLLLFWTARRNGLAQERSKGRGVRCKKGKRRRKGRSGRGDQTILWTARGCDFFIIFYRTQPAEEKQNVQTVSSQSF